MYFENVFMSVSSSTPGSPKQAGVNPWNIIFQSGIEATDVPASRSSWKIRKKDTESYHTSVLVTGGGCFLTEGGSQE